MSYRGFVPAVVGREGWKRGSWRSQGKERESGEEREERGREEREEGEGRSGGEREERGEGRSGDWVGGKGWSQGKEKCWGSLCVSPGGVPPLRVMCVVLGSVMMFVLSCASLWGFRGSLDKYTAAVTCTNTVPLCLIPEVLTQR